MDVSPSRVQPERPTNASQVREAYGRTVLTDQHYLLPTDQEEHDRLDIQHESLKRLMGGLYFVPELVERALTVGVPARIVDAGTGSGAWAVDIARERPECEVIGLDLVPPLLRSDHPPNLQFQGADLNNPPSLETASVNFVHARAIDHGILDYPKWLTEVSRILRPSGIYFVSKGRLTLVRDNGDDLPTVAFGEEGYTGLQNICSGMDKAIRAVWKGVDPVESWLTWLRENGNFENIGRTEMRLPIGAWKKGLDDNTQIAAELMRQNFLKMISTFKPALVTQGHEEAVVDRWIADATIELSELRVEVSAVWLAAWAVRSDKEVGL